MFGAVLGVFDVRVLFVLAESLYCTPLVDQLARISLPVRRVVLLITQVSVEGVTSVREKPICETCG